MTYTKEMHDYIVEIAPGRWNKEIAEMFNEKFGTSITPGMIRSYKANHKIISGRSNVDYSKKQYYNKLLTDEQLDYLKQIYKGISNCECTRMINERFNLNLSCSQIKGQKRRLKLDSGLTGRFEKGYVGPKRFEKGKHYSADTEFKKGHLPKNWVPIGTEIVNADGYVYVKVSDIRGAKYGHLINWKQKHRLIWEEAYGPIPEGHTLLFLDGNQLNITLENLVCISKSERLIMNRNKLIYDDPELTKTGVSIAKLIDKTNKMKANKS